MAGIEVLGLAATAASAVGSIASGIAASNQAKAQAAVAEMRAKEERAVAHREAERRRREGEMVLSRQRAVAAQGGGVSDPTVLDLMGDVAAESSYQQGIALYEGETRGRGLEAEAANLKLRARQAKLAGFIDAGSSMISGISGFSQYRTPTYSGGLYG